MDPKYILLLVNKLEEKMKIDDERERDNSIKVAKIEQTTKLHSRIFWLLFVMLVAYVVKQQ